LRNWGETPFVDERKKKTPKTCQGGGSGGRDETIWGKSRTREGKRVNSPLNSGHDSTSPGRFQRPVARNGVAAMVLEGGKKVLWRNHVWAHEKHCEVAGQIRRRKKTGRGTHRKGRRISTWTEKLGKRGKEPSSPKDQKWDRQMGGLYSSLGDHSSTGKRAISPTSSRRQGGGAASRNSGGRAMGREVKTACSFTIERCGKDSMNKPKRTNLLQRSFTDTWTSFGMGHG